MFTLYKQTIDFHASHGSYFVDKRTQTEYLDFFNMYSSIPLGYNHPVFDGSFDEEILRVSKLRMANNTFVCDELNEFRKEFRRHTFSDHIHFTCTGALAVESAIKCAMEYKKVKNPMVLGLTKAFHGLNSWGFITDRYAGTAKRMDTFPSNNWKNLEMDELIHFIETENCEDVVAVVIEPIQCTAGDLYFTTEQLKKLNNVCRQKDVAFIVDEIQTGFGATGTMWYYEQHGLDPDLVIFGKKSQICGIFSNEKYKEAITGPSMKLHVTFDGELLDAIRSKYILKAYEQGNLLERAKSNSLKYKEVLGNRVENYRSAGNLVAFDLESQEKRDQFISECMNNNFLCNVAGERSIRLRPHMGVTDQEISHFGEIMNKIFG